MNTKLAEKVYNCLKNSEYWTAHTKENGTSIANLICPECGDKTAWAHQQEPYSINCNRGNNCGVRTKTRELFDISIDIEAEYAPTKTDPNRPAREYLKSRGISDETLKGLDFRYWPKTRPGLTTGAVMFPVGLDKDGKEVLNGRLINPPPGIDKGNNKNSTTGKFFTHPARPLDPARPVALTEGIIDALSLIQMGCQAVAVLSSGQDPKNLKELQQYQLICAFDADSSGITATKKYLAAFPNSTAIMPDRKGQDWNDILQINPKTAAERFKENEKRYQQNAQINLAENAHEYGRMYYEFFGKVPGLFTFDGCTWFTELLTRGDTPRPKTERVGLFTIEVLAYINVGSDIQKEFLYQIKVKPKNSRPIDCIASGKNLSSAKDIGSFLLSHSCVNYEGKGNATTALGTMITTSKAPEVRQVNQTGYDPSTKWYVFDSYAIDEKGKIHIKDKNGLIKVSGKERITPAAQAGEKAIVPAQAPKVSVKDIYEYFVAAWGNNGATAFSWTIASWFVNQIKDKVGFFPYADFSGAPAAGKSALVTKLQALQGVDGEGLNISETSTKKGIARKIHGMSGMFCALLEFTDDNIKAMGFINILSAYNRGGGDMIQAKFSNDLETKQTPLLAALLFCQNKAPFKNQQEKQRAISLHFETKDLNNQTKQAYNALNDVPIEDLATVMVEVLKQRERIEAEWYQEYLVACGDLEAVAEERIKNNHALILAFQRLLSRLFGIQPDIFSHVEQIALLKEKTSAELEINDASLFFEQVYSSTSEQKSKYWHEIDAPTMSNKIDFNSLYFSLTELLRVLQNEGLQPPRAQTLQEDLKRHPAYIGHGVNHRFPIPPIENKQGPLSIQRKAWRFDLAKFRVIENPPNNEKNAPF